MKLNTFKTVISDDAVVSRFKKALGSDGLSLLRYQPRIVIKDGKVYELLDAPALSPVDELTPSDIKHLVSAGILKKEFSMTDGKGKGEYAKHTARFVDSQIRGFQRDMERYDEKMKSDKAKGDRSYMAFLQVSRESLADQIKNEIEPILKGTMVGYGYASKSVADLLGGKA